VSYHRAVAAALVTGARGGIGPSVVAALERDGWSVTRVDVEDADLADPESPRRLFDEAGPVRALVTCHACSQRGGLLETDAEQLDRHLAVNVRATALLMAEFARRFAGEPGTGRIVNFTSNLPLAGEVAYAASKGGVDWLTVAAAVELGPLGITVNAVDPGPTDTGWMTAELRDEVQAATPLGRLGRPEDAAALVAFLCSPAAGWITGQVIHSDGGFSWQRVARRGGEPR
jgi:3-oxoacyl-[acyl-carrier protein] reductase